jgi:ribosome-associated toxin RatA of RatAB toxin-antitoxin module
MSQKIEKTMRVNLPADQLWAVVNDFGGLHQYSPAIASSPIQGDKKTGLGAKRKCVFHNGNDLLEEIVDYREGQHITVSLSEHGMPLESMVVKMGIKKLDAKSSELSITCDFATKLGPVGWLMGALMIKPMMGGAFQKNMAGWAYFAATGKPVGDKLPSGDALAPVLA